jgi:hypothetical protein
LPISGLVDYKRMLQVILLLPANCRYVNLHSYHSFSHSCKHTIFLSLLPFFFCFVFRLVSLLFVFRFVFCFAFYFDCLLHYKAALAPYSVCLNNLDLSTASKHLLDNLLFWGQVVLALLNPTFCTFSLSLMMLRLDFAGCYLCKPLKVTIYVLLQFDCLQTFEDLDCFSGFSVFNVDDPGLLRVRYLKSSS